MRICRLARRSQGRHFSEEIVLTKERLNQLLDSEITRFALKQPQPVNLVNVLDVPEPERVAKFLLSELPIRFASRIKQIEQLPDYETNEKLLKVRDIYSESFKSLRTYTKDKDNGFSRLIENLKKRHRHIVPVLVGGIRELEVSKGKLTRTQVDDFLNTFFFSRISAEMLTSQYLALLKSPTGIVDRKCNPVRVCEVAARTSREMSRKEFGRAPRIKISGYGPEELRNFICIPTYLYYIMSEVLKNSVRAVVERQIKEGVRSYSIDNHSHEEVLINVIVSHTESQIILGVNDQGGGIPLEVQDKIWSYCYTTARKESRMKDLTEKPQNPQTQSAVPLAGFGVGLPLSRLYAQYLGGSMILISLPHYGTYTFVVLNRSDFGVPDSPPETPPKNISSFPLGPTPLKNKYQLEPACLDFLVSALPVEHSELIISKLQEQMITFAQLKQFTQVDLQALDLPYGAMTTLKEALQLTNNSHDSE